MYLVIRHVRKCLPRKLKNDSKIYSLDITTVMSYRLNVKVI